MLFIVGLPPMDSQVPQDLTAPKLSSSENVFLAVVETFSGCPVSLIDNPGSYALLTGFSRL